MEGTSSRTSVRWQAVRKLHVVRQGEWDHACGLYCVISAARFFGVPQKHLGLSRIVRNVDGRTKKLLSGPGVGWAELRAIASAAHLVLEDETKRPQVEATHQLWIARGTMMFSAADPDDIFPAGRTRNVYRHYVLARAAKGEHVEIVDPHPWHRKRRTITREEFGWFCTTAARISRR